MTMTMSEKLFLRRGEARERLGVTREGFAKLVAAGVLTALYFPGQTRAYFDAAQVNGARPVERTITKKRQGGKV